MGCVRIVLFSTYRINYIKQQRHHTINFMIMQTSFRKVAVSILVRPNVVFIYAIFDAYHHSLSDTLAHDFSLYLPRHLLLTFFFCCSHSIQICLVFVSPFVLFFFSAVALTLALPRDVVENVY